MFLSTTFYLLNAISLDFQQIQNTTYKVMSFHILKTINVYLYYTYGYIYLTRTDRSISYWSIYTTHTDRSILHVQIDLSHIGLSILHI